EDVHVSALLRRDRRKYAIGRGAGAPSSSLTSRSLRGLPTVRPRPRTTSLLFERQPSGDGLIRGLQLPIAKLCHLPERMREVSIVERQHVRKPLNRGARFRIVLGKRPASFSAGPSC